MAVFFLFCTVTSVGAADWHVAVGGSGSGSAAEPFGSVQAALDAAQPGDTIVVGPGAFNESLISRRAGTEEQRITVRASGKRGTSIVTALGRVLTVRHPYLTIDGLVLDGQFGPDDLVRAFAGAHGLTLRNAEIRRSGHDAVDLGAVDDVLIESSLIHHALDATRGRTDAHGVVAGAVRRLTIRNTEIHTFSGDAFQADPDRSPSGWSDVLIEGCRFWLGPLPEDANGFLKGTVPGENAIDTKTSRAAPRARLVVRDTVAFGFRDGLIGNMAAFNLKESVDAVLDRVTVFDSDIAFRLRGPANVRVQNAVVHTVERAVRYEDNIADLKIWNSTFGRGIRRLFQAASAGKSTLDIRNALVLGASLPRVASHSSNLAVRASSFVNAAKHDYQLRANSPAIDKGVTIPEVETDRRGVKRPRGRAYDIGAYEHSGGSNRGQTVVKPGSDRGLTPV